MGCKKCSITPKQKLEEEFLPSPHNVGWLVAVNDTGDLILLLNCNIEGKDSGKSAAAQGCLRFPGQTLPLPALRAQVGVETLTVATWTHPVRVHRLQQDYSPRGAGPSAVYALAKGGEMALNALFQQEKSHQQEGSGAVEARSLSDCQVFAFSVFASDFQTSR